MAVFIKGEPLAEFVLFTLGFIGLVWLLTQIGKRPQGRKRPAESRSNPPFLLTSILGFL